MDPKQKHQYQQVKRLLQRFFWMLFVLIALMGLAHLLWHDVKAGGTSWFNLDKERNLPTWFSGILLFSVAIASLFAHRLERHLIQQTSLQLQGVYFWILLSIIGVGLSLDEMLILHENLYWREIRQISEALNPTLIYITQWQLLLAPLMVFLLALILLFLHSRLTFSIRTRLLVAFGIGTWTLAIFFESIRQWFLFSGSDWYQWEVIIEELLELAGTVFLLVAILSYCLEIFYRSEALQSEAGSSFGKLFSVDGMKWVSVFLAVVLFGATMVYSVGKSLETKRAPIPTLQKRAIDR
ncbi:MAG: hypothetical protein HQL54_12870 [Magnetococcales bacterium]|nr:hypothetical protein [Magnetococcales bacterium]